VRTCFSKQQQSTKLTLTSDESVVLATEVLAFVINVLDVLNRF
jgi:hypothetical protein